MVSTTSAWCSRVRDSFLKSCMLVSATTSSRLQGCTNFCRSSIHCAVMPKGTITSVPPRAVQLCLNSLVASALARSRRQNMAVLPVPVALARIPPRRSNCLAPILATSSLRMNLLILLCLYMHHPDRPMLTNGEYFTVFCIDSVCRS